MAAADRDAPLGDRLRALTALAELGDASASASEIEDELLEILEDDHFVDATCARGEGWALAAVASLAGDDAVWKATRRLLALKLESAGESGVAIASLRRLAGDTEVATTLLARAEPPSTSGAAYAVWVEVVASWLDDEATRPDLVLALRAAGALERTCAGFDASDLRSGAWVEQAVEWLLDSLKTLSS